MKKVYSFIYVVAFAVLAMLTSCENQDISFLVGDWKLDAAAIGGTKKTVDEIKSQFGKYVPYIDQSTAQLRSDKTFSIVLPQDGTTKTGTFSYNKSKNTIDFTSGKTTITATYVDGQIIAPYQVEEGIISLTLSGYYKKVQ